MHGPRARVRHAAYNITISVSATCAAPARDTDVQGLLLHKMVKAKASGMRYVLLMNAEGHYVQSTPSGLKVSAKASDGACWRLDRSSSDGGAGPVIFHHPATKVTMQAAPAALPCNTAPGEGIVLVAGIPSACTLRCPRPVPGRDA